MPEPCPDDDVLAAHVAGELGGAEVEAIAAHLDGCDDCRAVVGALVKAPQTVAGSPKRRRGPGVSLGGMVDRYRVDRVLGSGGMGIVYAAHDTELGRDVALKVMRPELGAAAGIADRLVRESRLMARVSHPSVITVHDVGRHGEQVFVAMELIAGTTLGGWLRERRPGWRDVVELFRRAGEGLAAAHRAGLVHRDFKPENVLLAVDGETPTRVIVTDLGVARAIAGDDEGDGVPTPPGTLVHATLTATGVAVGTPAYMAPEQLEARRVDARADVFAFAVALWEALWGERPFPGRSVAEIRAAMERGVPAPPRSGVPAWVGRVLVAALAVDPARRPATMEELIARLDPRRHDRQRRLLAATAGVVLVGAAAGAGAYAVSDDPPPPAAAAPGVCADDGLAAVWTDDARARLRAAVATSASPAATAIADRAIATTDAYARRWEDTRARVCAGADEAQRSCLVGRRRLLGDLLAQLGALSPPELTQLDFTMSSLPSVEICATPSASTASLPELDDAAAAVYARIAAIDVIRLAGDHRHAADALEALGPEVDALAVPALTAEYLLAFGITMGELDSARSVDLLRRGAAEAEKARHDEAAARGWLELAFTYAERMSDPDRGAEALMHADAAITRAGDSPAQRIQYRYTEARILHQQMKFAEEEALLRALIEDARAVAPDAVVQMQQALAGALTEQGEFEAALAIDRAALAEREAQFGPDHVLVAEARNQMATDLLYLGDVDAALAELETAAAIAARAYGPINEWTGLYRNNIAEALRNAGRYEESLAAHAQARPVLAATRGAEDMVIALSLENEAGALMGLGRWAEAESRLREALAVYRIAVGDEHFETAKCRINLAEALRALGRHDEALADGRAGLEVFRAVHGEDHPFVAYARAELGKTLLAAGRRGDAITELEAAVRIYEGGEMDPAAVADAGFALARAIVGSQRPRALELARGALAVFTETGGEWTDDADAARAWLAKQK